MSDCQRQLIMHNYEPVHDETNKMTCAQWILVSTWASAQSDQSFRWRKLWSLATLWAPSKYSDQAELMPRLIWVFAGRTGHFVGFVMRWLIYEPRHNKTCLRGLRPVKAQTSLLSYRATETSLGLEISAIARRGVVRSRQRTTKAVIILCECAYRSSVWN